jgi:hypothetical protein
MGFFKKKICHYYGQEEQRGTEEIGKKIGELGEESSAAEQRGEVLCWLGEIATDGSCLISIVDNDREKE